MASQDKASAVFLDPEHINELSRPFWDSAILRAGIKLVVFEVTKKPYPAPCLYLHPPLKRDIIHNAPPAVEGSMHG